MNALANPLFDKKRKPKTAAEYKSQKMREQAQKLKSESETFSDVMFQRNQDVLDWLDDLVELWEHHHICGGRTRAFARFRKYYETKGFERGVHGDGAQPLSGDLKMLLSQLQFPSQPRPTAPAPSPYAWSESPGSLGRERAERRVSEEQREQRLKLDRATVERDSLRERLESIRLSKRGEQPKGAGEPDAG